VKEESRRIEAPNLKEQPQDFKAYYTPEFGDQLFVRSYRAGKWSKPIAITGPREDLNRCAIAAEGDGTVWVVYSANREGKHNLFARPIDATAKPGPERALTAAGGFLHPVTCTDQNGNVQLVCRCQEKGDAILATFNGVRGEWTDGKRFISVKGSVWYPAIGAGPSGQVVQAFDRFADGDYDVLCGLFDGTKQQFSDAVATSSHYEARPSVCYDPAGRLWIAYEEGPEQWGKNFGALDHSGGHPLYFARTVKVVCLENGKLLAASTATSGPSRSRCITPTACSTAGPSSCRIPPAACASSTTPTAGSPRQTSSITRFT
jgi:hypothetical protein